MTIDQIVISHHTHKLETPFPPAWDSRPRETFSATIVRVTDSDGIEGVGSGDAMHGFADYAHLFLGEDPSDLKRHAAVLENVAFHASRCWPLDMALWDLEGKRQGKPVHKLMGGRANRVRAYASSGTHRSPEETADLAKRYLELGYPAMKVRLGRRRLDDDFAVLAAVRDAVGDKLELMVDCNQGWRMPWDTGEPWDLAKALAVSHRLREFDVFWMEEPLDRSDLKGMKELRAQSKVRIAGAEMTREIRDLHNLLTFECLDFIQADVVLCGGFLGLKELAQRAEEQDAVLTPHTWGNGVGLIGNAHLTAGASSAPFLEFPFDPPLWNCEGRDFMLTDPVTVDRQGWINLGEEPGFGLSLNEEYLKSTETHREEFV